MRPRALSPLLCTDTARLPMTASSPPEVGGEGVPCEGTGGDSALEVLTLLHRGFEGRGVLLTGRRTGEHVMNATLAFEGPQQQCVGVPPAGNRESIPLQAESSWHSMDIEEGTPSEPVTLVPAIHDSSMNGYPLVVRWT